jgi:hypothetical protein
MFRPGDSTAVDRANETGVKNGTDRGLCLLNLFDDGGVMKKESLNQLNRAFGSIETSGSAVKKDGSMDFSKDIYGLAALKPEAKVGEPSKATKDLVFSQLFDDDNLGKGLNNIKKQAAA